MTGENQREGNASFTERRCLVTCATLLGNTLLNKSNQR